MARVGWAHFCDYAFFDRDGKVCLIGIFKNILTQRVPANHTRCAFVFQLVGQPNEQVNVNLKLIRPDGKDPLVDLYNPNIVLNPDGEAIHIIGLDNLPLPDYGPYEMRIFINRSYAAGSMFTVHRLITNQQSDAL